MVSRNMSDGENGIVLVHEWKHLAKRPHRIYAKRKEKMVKSENAKEV